MKSKPPSLIKWTGSKRAQSLSIAQFFPPAGNSTYFEPFLGGGAMLYYGAKHFKRAIASDIYQPLVDLWQHVKESSDQVIADYQHDWQLLQDNFPNYFFDVRQRFNLTPSGQDLLFLSRTCVNGIIRFNKQGEFNNSIHLSRRGMKPILFSKIAKRWAAELSHTTFLAQDYSEILHQVRPNDFVYMDPPYANSHNRYAEDLDIERFVNFLFALNKKKVKWALSFDGSRNGEDFSYDLPTALYCYKTELSNGHSAVQKVLNSSVEEVRESLYLNYNPPIPTQLEQGLLL